MNNNHLVIGTRGSALALKQANWVKDRLEEAWIDLKVDLSIIKTKGDKILDVPLAKVGGKGLFVKEIEDALLDGRVDLAVHSMKDVPTDLPEGLFIAAVPPRVDYRDALISKTGAELSDLPAGSKIGTSSLRRQAQLLRLRPDVVVVTLRGNLDTRINKLFTENLDAIIVAAAGLERMGLTHRATQFLEPETMLPAIGQGTLGVEARSDDHRVLSRLTILHHQPSAVRLAAERAFLATMGGGCQVPLAALAELSYDHLTLTGLVADPDARRYYRQSITSPISQAVQTGHELANRLLAAGGRDIMMDLLKNMAEA
ncbi:MAG: hydroxymethylbilane synthase [Deltaproteobacteria bacterium]|nr:hydroxymethylbilane synthase [Deltaproteobacteria bacterium]